MHLSLSSNDNDCNRFLPAEATELFMETDLWEAGYANAVFFTPMVSSIKAMRWFL